MLMGSRLSVQPSLRVPDIAPYPPQFIQALHEQFPEVVAEGLRAQEGRSANDNQCHPLAPLVQCEVPEFMHTSPADCRQADFFGMSLEGCNYIPPPTIGQIFRRTTSADNVVVGALMMGYMGQQAWSWAEHFWEEPVPVLPIAKAPSSQVRAALRQANAHLAQAKALLPRLKNHVFYETLQDACATHAENLCALSQQKSVLKNDLRELDLDMKTLLSDIHEAIDDLAQDDLTPGDLTPAVA